MSLSFYNTMSKKAEEFSPLSPPKVTLYHCGPTVYNYAHIGNLRAFVFADLLRRTLELSDFEVFQVMNITDVGHLVSEGDDGEDKMEAGAKREGKTAKEIATMYEEAFHEDLQQMNVKKAHVYPRATEHIQEQIDLIEVLIKKGFAYSISDGVYFDTSFFSEYGKMARLNIAGQQEGARVDINTEKRNTSDFALWKFSKLQGEKREQEWESPWGVGFPGWHIECSAMAMKYLGESIDIHTGGIDHIPVHHTNEIAQSECATGKPFAHFWMHSAFMNVDGQKMSKSLRNTFVLSDLSKRGISPMAFRYWLLTSHYRTLVNFTWDAVLGASKALERLQAIISNLPEGGKKHSEYTMKITEAYSSDLDTPRIVALIWECLKDDNVSLEDKRETFFFANKVLGLSFQTTSQIKTVTLKNGITYQIEGGHDASFEIEQMIIKRHEARLAKDFSESDRIRLELETLGYAVLDTSEGQVIKNNKAIS